jgi:hypothetical protein
LARLSRISNRRTKRHGATLIEVVTASFLGVMVMLATVMLLISGMASWYRGEGRIRAESTSQIAVRTVAAEIREAMMVSVDANGMGLTYRLPQTDGNGSYLSPAQWDGVTRRIQLNGSNIEVVEGGNARVLCRNVITTDPQSVGGMTAYRIFTSGAGAITRQVTVMVVTRTNSYRQEQSSSRSRETVYLRNIPELARG